MYIQVDSVSKKYANNAKSWARYKVNDFIVKLLSVKNNPELRKNEFWAVKDISFRLEQGDVLGVIGRNGCGKTTLLRMIANILEPEAGRIDVGGRTDYLSASGFNYNPKLTGLENIWVLGIMMGMKVHQIRDKIDVIADYSELGEFLQMPVSCYSSGMKSRLGFSVAIHMNPEILIIDETLSAGDENFRKKSIESVKYLAKQNVCLFASHSLNQVREIANKALYIEKGKVVYFGDVSTAIDLYRKSLSADSVNIISKAKKIDLMSICINGITLPEFKSLREDQDNVMELRLNFSPILQVLKTRMVFINIFRKKRYISWGPDIEVGTTGELTMSCIIPYTLLDVGRYRLRLDFFNESKDEIVHTHKTKAAFIIPGAGLSPKREQIELKWNLYS